LADNDGFLDVLEWKEKMSAIYTAYN